MKRTTLSFMPRSEFSKLSLHDKNAYLQQMTQAYMEAKKQDYVPLTKDALSGLRRFYLRGSFADLKL